MTDIAAAILCVGLCANMVWAKTKNVKYDGGLDSLIAILAALKVLI